MLRFKGKKQFYEGQLGFISKHFIIQMLLLSRYGNNFLKVTQDYLLLLKTFIKIFKNLRVIQQKKNYDLLILFPFFSFISKII